MQTILFFLFFSLLSSAIETLTRETALRTRERSFRDSRIEHGRLLVNYTYQLSVRCNDERVLAQQCISSWWKQSITSCSVTSVSERILTMIEIIKREREKKKNICACIARQIASRLRCGDIGNSRSSGGGVK